MDLNKCCCCGIDENTLNLIWIDSEDFNPLNKDNFNQEKFNICLKKCWSALCEDCYIKNCCGVLK